jgi:hypothetical protein
MDSSNCRISTETADAIALTIYNDISSFIAENEADYQEWLKHYHKNN